MSSISQEFDATLQHLDARRAKYLESLVRDAMASCESNVNPTGENTSPGQTGTLKQPRVPWRTKYSSVHLKATFHNVKPGVMAYLSDFVISWKRPVRSLARMTCR